jgi:hypothetical protein
MAILQQMVQPRMVYIHKETTNQSFIDMHNYLKAKGIQNNDFFLILFDPGLKGINPYDPNLPQHIKVRIMNECRINYWYFLREVVRIPQQGDTGNGTRYHLNRGNLAMNFLFQINFNMFVIFPRQKGKTTCALCRYLWVYNFGTTNSEIMFMHKDHTGSKKNLRDLKAIRDNLPSYLQMSSAIDHEGKKLKVPNTIVNIQHPYNNNKIITFPSARTRDAANNLGRGSTQPLQYYDEFAFIPFNKEVYLAATPAFSTASKNAARNHAPYGILLTTTPGDLLNDSGKFAYDVFKGSIPWNENYYDSTMEEFEGIKKLNKTTFFGVQYTYQQLGDGQKYFNDICMQMLYNWPEIRREVLLEWAETSNDCPFSSEDLDVIQAYCKPPIKTLLFGRFKQYQFNIYEDIDTAYPPIVGVDVSGCTYKDASAITVIDSKTTRVGATMNCNYIPADDLAMVIYELVSKYLPNAIVNIESNGGYGSSVIAMLKKTSVKRNLYWEIKDRVVEERFDGMRMVQHKQKMRVYCLYSTPAVRNRLIEILFERVMYHKDKFVAPILHEEMRGMVTKKSGKVEHSDSTHDDQVFSYLMALYVWYDGKNLAENWGVMKNTLKTDSNNELDEITLEDNIEKIEKVDPNVLAEYEEGSTMAEVMQFIEENSKFINADQFKEQMRDVDRNRLNRDLMEDTVLRQAYCKNYGIDERMIINNTPGIYTQLPPELFEGGDEEMDFRDDFDYLFDDAIVYDHNGNRIDRNTLRGNLSNQWTKV